MNPEETALPPALKRATAKVRASGANHKDWIFRIVIFVLIAGSLTLSWWSLTQRLMPLQKRSRELSTSVSRLSSAVDELDRKFSKAQAERVGRPVQLGLVQGRHQPRVRLQATHHAQGDRAARHALGQLRPPGRRPPPAPLAR